LVEGDDSGSARDRNQDGSETRFVRADLGSTALSHISGPA